MGLFTLAFAGGSFVLLGAYESLTPTIPSPLPSLKSPNPNPNTNPNPNPQFSTLTLVSTLALSLLFLLDSLISFFSARNNKDHVGSALQLQTLAVSALFLMFSILGLVSNLSRGGVSFPYELMGLIVVFGFVEEFLVFYMRRDGVGVENRYYDLMLVPIGVCVVCSVVELRWGGMGAGAAAVRLGRGIGLVLQGTWFVQMGFSFYSGFVASNCGLRERSRGNFSVVCKGHMDSHRGMAIAVLLFNCHLAFLVAVVACVYSVIGRRIVGNGDYARYRPLGAKMQVVDAQARFTLDSDDDDAEGIREVRDEENVLRLENGVFSLEVNGHGSDH
ncbi:hypothetical protein Droror1_Dr00020048 [Drosera rotundifolia]